MLKFWLLPWCSRNETPWRLFWDVAPPLFPSLTPPFCIWWWRIALSRSSSIFWNTNADSASWCLDVDTIGSSRAFIFRRSWGGDCWELGCTTNGGVVAVGYCWWAGLGILDEEKGSPVCWRHRFWLMIQRNTTKPQRIRGSASTASKFLQCFWVRIFCIPLYIYIYIYIYNEDH